MAGEFGGQVKAIMERGAHEARRAGSATIEAEHLLLAIAADPVTREPLGLDRQAVQDALDLEFRHSLGVAGVSIAELPPPRPTASAPSRIGASGKLVLERGVAMARRKRDLRPAHLLLGVLLAEVGTVPRALELAGVDRAELVARVRRLLAQGDSE